MNLRTIKSNVVRCLHPADPTETTQRIANRLYQNRVITQRNGDADSDWTKAERIRKNKVRQLLFWLNQPCIWTEKQVAEPVAQWVNRTELFQIFERLNPTLEALGVIAIPIVLFFAARSYEESLLQRELNYQTLLEERELERSQQQAINDYLNQLSNILIEIEGSFRDPKNSELRILITTTTLTLLSDPNLDGVRKGQAIKFLSQMGLIQGNSNEEAIVSLESADLSISENNFGESGISVHGTILSNADLRGANLSNADLRGADLSNADLRGANLQRAVMGDANVKKSDNVKGNRRLTLDITIAASLDGTNLAGTDLYGVDLSDYMGLTQSQLESAYLCRTTLPEGLTLNPDRDCERLSYEVRRET